MGIRDRPTSFRSLWQNGHVERLIGSIRRECIDHLIVLNEEHLRRILTKFVAYYNGWRPHVSLGKDADARSSVPGTSSHMQSLADCITGTHESSFWKRQVQTPCVKFRERFSRFGDGNSGITPRCRV
ncbi:MAG TPA: integrase core domain-containing protein [Pseudolabrys sp.]|nr:integrase core domain-containing protein [Pseudolabrys sp.]